jgi:hypothetical protein
MKAFLCLFLCCIAQAIYAQSSTAASAPDADLLSGEWSIDLRPTPDSEEYIQSFVVKSISKNTFHGTFYGSDIKNALINKNWDRLYFAFETSDSSNDYYHSGYLLDGQLFGISYCPNRNFVAPWTGRKK